MKIYNIQLNNWNEVNLFLSEYSATELNTVVNNNKIVLTFSI